MPRKTKIIFIVVFIIVGAVMLGIYFTKQRAANTNTQTNSTTGYQLFNPLGGNSGSTTPSSSTTAPDTTTARTSEVSVPTGPNTVGAVTAFHQLTTFAIAGATYLDDTRPVPQVESTTSTTKKASTPAVETVPAIRYVERMTGHIYEIYLDDITNNNEISNSTIPSIYEAIFDSKASTVIYRYLEADNTTITSFMATLGAAKGAFLPSNITDLSVSADKSKFFYLVENPNGVTGTIQQFVGTKKSQVFSSPFTEWLSQWAGSSSKIYLTTKAAATVDGYLFALNTTTGTLTKVLGGIPGLTTLANNTGTTILYSSSASGGPKLSILNTTTGASTDTSIYTLPEKCVWSQDNVTAYCAIPDTIGNGVLYPDDWYQGNISFTDQFVKLDTKTGQATVIADSAAVQPIDGTHLFLNKDESELFFTNKKDGTLWELDLK
jgi:hypothetical protein